MILAFRGRRPGNRGRNDYRDSQRNNRRETPRSAMLNIGRLGGFKYDLREIIRRSRIDETFAPSFIASIVAKASRISIQDAKIYVKESKDVGKYSDTVSNEICGLLDYYSKYR